MTDEQKMRLIEQARASVEAGDGKEVLGRLLSEKPAVAPSQDSASPVGDQDGKHRVLGGRRRSAARTKKTATALPDVPPTPPESIADDEPQLDEPRTDNDGEESSRFVEAMLEDQEERLEGLRGVSQPDVHHAGSHVAVPSADQSNAKGAPAHAATEAATGVDVASGDAGVVEEKKKKKKKKEEGKKKTVKPGSGKKGRAPVSGDLSVINAAEADVDVDEADPDEGEMAEPGSDEERKAFAAFGRGPDGISEAAERQKRVQDLAAVTAQAAEKYVRTTEKERTLKQRLRAVLGLKNDFSSGDRQRALQEYQQAFRAEMAFKIEDIQREHEEDLKNIEESAEKNNEPIDALALKSAELRLQQQIADIVEAAHTKANIDLYMCRMRMESEKEPGPLARFKQFGERYNALPLKWKFLGGMAMTAGAVASGSVLPIVIKQMMVAAGSFVTFDAGLEAWSRKVATRAAEDAGNTYRFQEQQRTGVYDAKTERNMQTSELGRPVLSERTSESELLKQRLSRLQSHLDTAIIQNVDALYAARVQGLDRRRLSAMVGAIGVAFALPRVSQYLMHTETGTAVSGAAQEVVGKAAEHVNEAVAPVKEVVAQDAAKEIVAKQSTELSTKLAGLLGQEATVPKGGSIWTMLKHGIVEKLNPKDFTDIPGLDLNNAAQETYINDYLKNVELKARGGNSLLQIGEKFTSHITQDDIEKALRGAAKLTTDQQENILANVNIAQLHLDAAQAAGSTAKEAVHAAAGALTTDGSNPFIDEGTRRVASESVSSSVGTGQGSGITVESIPSGRGLGSEILNQYSSTYNTSEGYGSGSSFGSLVRIHEYMRSDIIGPGNAARIAGLGTLPPVAQQVRVADLVQWSHQGTVVPIGLNTRSAPIILRTLSDVVNVEALAARNPSATLGEVVKGLQTEIGRTGSNASLAA